MSEVHFPNDPDGVFFAIELADFRDISWAGGIPFQESFCLGSETGKMIFVDVALKRSSRLLLSVSPSGEAVNGVAYSRNWLAVTTRKDINFIGALPGTQQEIISFNFGGQDVAVAPSSGHFVIPLGPSGIMFAKPGIGEDEPVTIARPGESGLNFCRVIALPTESGKDVVVAAGRHGGVGYADYWDGIAGHTLHSVTFDKLDIVDVRSLATPERPLAVVAVAKDGSLVFFNNILTDKTPHTIKFNSIKGNVYRILDSQGDIYLLTSKGLFGLFRLAAKLLRGETADVYTTEILNIPIEAVDANTVGNKWLLAVGTDALIRIDLAMMPKSPKDGTNATKTDASEASESVRMPGRWEEPVHIPVLPRWAESGFVNAPV